MRLFELRDVSLQPRIELALRPKTGDERTRAELADAGLQVIRTGTDKVRERVKHGKHSLARCQDVVLVDSARLREAASWLHGSFVHGALYRLSSA